MNDKKFALGDIVEWTSQAGTTMTGKIWKIHDGVHAGLCCVRVDNIYCYHPRVSQLRKVAP